jgi:hypothetical protein
LRRENAARTQDLDPEKTHSGIKIEVDRRAVEHHVADHSPGDLSVADILRDIDIGSVGISVIAHSHG